MSERTPHHDSPVGAPVLSTIAMPGDTNPSGDIFGGWLVSQMDLAGGVLARRRVRGRVVTVAIDAMKFHLPVLVGDRVSCFGRIARIGRTSITVAIETWAQRALDETYIKVTEGHFTYVAIDDHRRPTPIDGAH